MFMASVMTNGSDARNLLCATRKKDSELAVTHTFLQQQAGIEAMSQQTREEYQGL